MPVLYREEDSKGFTLIEIIITLAIMVVLAAISIPLFNKYKQKGYDAELAADAKNAYTAAQAYISDDPTTTIDTQTKLASGGYRFSQNIEWRSGSMTTSSGSLVLLSRSAEDSKNVATILFNGNIDIAP
jgi:prepilin-type N-terminal cleavage/methylation domain-containing protein